MKTINVLHLSTHNENCGIGMYQEQFLQCMQPIEGVKNEFFRWSPNKLKVMPPNELKSAMEELKTTLKQFDILHIQHEYSFFKQNELEQAITIAKHLKKKVIVTFHTAPDAHYPKPELGNIRIKSALKYAHKRMTFQKFLDRYILPINKADLVLTPNNITRDNLIKHGVKAEIITVFTHPIPEVKAAKKSTELHKQLKIKKGDILLSTVGYISETKGVLEAVKALLFLPDNYKLAIIGGLHPQGGADQFLNHISDVIIQNNLQQRVHITGFVEGEARKNALIQEVDVCLYPYDKGYYNYVSSAALSDAFANHKAIVAYPTNSFRETSAESEALTFTPAFSYHELARTIKELDIPAAAERSKQFALANTYSKKAKQLVEKYQMLLK